LKAAESGQKVTDLCRKHGISEHTFYRWRAKYGGMDVSDARKLRSLEDENRRLKTLVADLTLDNQMLKAVVARKW
jgi:putative transposase